MDYRDQEVIEEVLEALRSIGLGDLASIVLAMEIGRSRAYISPPAVEDQEVLAILEALVSDGMIRKSYDLPVYLMID